MSNPPDEDASFQSLPNAGYVPHFAHDFPASLVVFLVALPLCMGIAIASGVPVAAGLITGIVGGIVVGLFSGSPLQASGPAAGLTVIVLAYVNEHGLPVLGLIVLVAGILQLLSGVFRMGQWFRAVSPAVIRGMLSGIGVLIFASQFHVMVDDKPRKGGLENLASIPEAIQKGLPLPELTSREIRSVKTHQLKVIGGLHEHQQEIREIFDERLPNEMPEDESISVDRFPMEKLTERQRQIVNGLSESQAALEEVELTSGETKQSQRLKKALDEARFALTVALDDILGGNLSHIRESQAEAEAALLDVLASMKNHDWAAKIGIATILALVLWQLIPIKSLHVIPGPLVAVIVAMALAGAFGAPVLYVEVPDNLIDGVHTPTWTVIQQIEWTALLQAGLVIAVVASAETLLCATAVDTMHNGVRTNYDRELTAQGLGNIVCGFLGALPMTGVIVRSSANVLAGARTRWSTIMHGIWLLLFVAALGFVLRQIPTSGLAAILVYTGYKLMNPWQIKDLARYGAGEVFIYIVTVAVIVIEDLLTGVIVGVILSGIKLLYTFSHLESKLTLHREEKRATLMLTGAATFIRLPTLAKELEQVPRGYELHVEFSELGYIDHACLELMMNWSKQHEATGGELVIDWESLHRNFRRGGNSKNKTDEAAA